RQNPFIRFNQDKKLHRTALEITGRSHTYAGGETLFKAVGLMIEAGEKIAVIGANGVGKTTFLRCLVNHVTPAAGSIKWAENADVGYYAQDPEYEFVKDINLFDWMEQWIIEAQDVTAVCASLCRLLFKADAIKKNV